jgi:hypothetical protein
MTTDLNLFKDKVFTVRGQQVMLAKDVAEALGMDTYHLNENAGRSPKWDYARDNGFEDKLRFQLTDDEIQCIEATQNGVLQRVDRLSRWVYTQQGCIYFGTSLNTAAACYQATQMMVVFHAFQEGKFSQRAHIPTPVETKQLGSPDDEKKEKDQYAYNEYLYDKIDYLTEELREHRQAMQLKEERRLIREEKARYLKKLRLKIPGFKPSPLDKFFRDIPENIWVLYPKTYAELFPGRAPVKSAPYPFGSKEKLRY